MNRSVTIFGLSRLAPALLAAALLLALIPTAADAHGPEPHGHVLLLHADFSPNPNYDSTDATLGPRLFIHDYEGCVDLANGRVLHNRAHHQGIHTGAAGRALEDRSPHLVVPLAPLTPFTGCAQIDEIYGK